MDALWVLVPAGQQASGEWIDDTLRARAAEKGLLGRSPRARSVSSIHSPDACWPAGTSTQRASTVARLLREARAR